MVIKFGPSVFIYSVVRIRSNVPDSKIPVVSSGPRGLVLSRSGLPKGVTGVLFPLTRGALSTSDLRLTLNRLPFSSVAQTAETGRLNK